MKKLMLISLLMTAVSAQASVKSIRAAEEKCLEKAVSNMAMIECASTALQDARNLLDSVVNKLTSELSKSSDEDNKEILKRLQNSQKAWEIYSEALCEYEAADMLGGSGEPLIQVSCLAEETLKRIEALQDRR